MLRETHSQAPHIRRFQSKVAVTCVVGPTKVQQMDDRWSSRSMDPSMHVAHERNR